LRDYLATNVPRAVHRADWILADSESTRQDLIELIGAPEDRTTVIYPGVEPRFGRVADRETLARAREKYGLPGRFILSLGTVQPRKNYVGLIRAFAHLAPKDTKLVIVGGKGWLYQEIYACVEDLNLQDRVLFAGFVDDVDLPAVYNLAEVFCLPSLYEGFGIPPLEAMACGVPVITADNSSLPEVVGDAGILVDAYDQDALVDALDQLLTDPATRAELTSRGLSRAAQFTWAKAAQQLLATYNHLCETG
jgi:glycosyltransferase involved in cell wall biosynthesis